MGLSCGRLPATEPQFSVSVPQLNTENFRSGLTAKSSKHAEVGGYPSVGEGALSARTELRPVSPEAVQREKVSF